MNRAIKISLILLATKVCAASDLKDLVEYNTVRTKEQQLIHILETDPTTVNIIAKRAKDVGSERETVQKIARDFNAIAAVNASFFRVNNIGDTIASGVLKIDNKWHGIAYKTRAAIGWENLSKTVLIDRVQTSTKVKIKSIKYPVNTMNQQLHSRKTALYSDNYSKIFSALTASYYAIKNGKIVDYAIYQQDKDIKIPEGGYVYAIGKNSDIKPPLVKLNDSAKVNIYISPEISSNTANKWGQLPFIVGGAPLLIYNGKKITNFKQERLRKDFLYNRHARTAIGILPNNNWLIVVVEQNALINRVGMTIPELTSLMHELGCKYAINLDGGSSTTLYITDYIVNSSPEDENNDYNVAILRRVFDSILILPKQ